MGYTDITLAKQQDGSASFYITIDGESELDINFSAVAVLLSSSRIRTLITQLSEASSAAAAVRLFAEQGGSLETLQAGNPSSMPCIRYAAETSLYFSSVLPSSLLLLRIAVAHSISG